MNEIYMKTALELAKKGEGKVNPNPLVGAVIVKEEKIIAKGYHKKFGEEHAEINAINNLKESAKGATMYVTLEPCSYFGKTPPCVDAIIKEEIGKVVIGTLDPNPLVSGKGVKILKDNGISVVVGVLENECVEINEVFMKFIKTKTPFVLMKSAMTLDGKIATYTGNSKWITSEESRLNSHKLRNKLSAIMVGINTVINDNPKLTCRIENGRNPIRIIVDSKLRIPLESNVLKINKKKNDKVIIATTLNANEKKIELLESRGVTVLKFNEKNRHVDLSELMLKLGEMNIDGILLEGGGTINFSALEEGIVDKVMIYIAPVLFGGKDAKTPVEGKGIEEISEKIKLKDIKISNVGDDVLVEGMIERS